MQLGSRWSVGAPPPRGFPPELIAAIAETEAALSADEAATLRWTVTWLEGRPVVELDNGTILHG